MFSRQEYRYIGEVAELVESTGLENRRRATVRGFESHPLRHLTTKALVAFFCASTSSFNAFWRCIEPLSVPGTEPFAQ